MTDKVQKIREEIERVKTVHSSVSLKNSKPDILVVQVCINLLSLIDSMQEENVNDDLEKEMESYFIGMEVQAYENIFEDTFKKIARHFADWEKKQIAKENMLLPFKEYDNLMDSVEKKKKEGYLKGFECGKNDANKDFFKNQIEKIKEFLEERRTINYEYGNSSEGHEDIEILEFIESIEGKTKFKVGDSVSNGVIDVFIMEIDHENKRYVTSDVCGENEYIPFDSQNNWKITESYTNDNFDRGYIQGYIDGKMEAEEKKS